MAALMSDSQFEISEEKVQRASARLSTLHQKKARFLRSTEDGGRKNQHPKKLKRSRHSKTATSPSICGKRKYVLGSAVDHSIDDDNLLEDMVFKVPPSMTFGDVLASKVGAIADEKGLSIAHKAQRHSLHVGVAIDEGESELESFRQVCTDLHEQATDRVATTVLGVMGAKPDMAEIQEQGLRALQQWAVKKGYRAIVDVGGIPVLLKAMAEHRERSSLQQLGCNLLSRIVACSGVASSAGVAAVLAAINTHDALDVQKAGCQALKELAARKDGSIQNEIVARSGLEAVFKAMDKHVSNAEIQISACGVMRNLGAGNTCHQDTIIALGGLQRVTKLMMLHSQCPTVQAAGMWTLFCLAFKNDAAKVEIVSNGSISMILHAMTTHIKALVVQEAGCWALKELSCSIQGDSKRTECIQALSSALTAHTSNSELSKVGRLALRKLFAQTQTRFFIGGAVCKRRRCGAPPNLPTIQE